MPRRTSLEVKFGAKVKLGPIMELAKSLHAQGEAAFSAGDEYGGLALMRQAVDVLEQSSGQPGFNAEAHYHRPRALRANLVLAPIAPPTHE